MMTCWSCMYYRPDGCLQNLTQYRQVSAGPECPWFDYEPGSDEKVTKEEQTLTNSTQPSGPRPKALNMLGIQTPTQ